jgi:predicted metalloprotease
VNASRRALALRLAQYQRERLLFFFAAIAAVVALAGGIVARQVAEDQAAAYSDPFDRWPPSETAGTATTVVGAPKLDAALARFLEFVATDIQSFWARGFERAGLPYAPARVAVFRRRARTSCGEATAAMGPFYCTLDRTVYLEPGFFRQLAVEYRAPGDFAQAYVIAHEFGHHVQNLTGITAQEARWAEQGAAAPQLLSVATELQADCLAGVWGHSTYERGMLENGDVEEALRAAAAVGDDRVQVATTGRIDPETWTHGSSEQRISWFSRGFETGDPGACDSFSAALG